MLCCRLRGLYDLPVVPMDLLTPVSIIAPCTLWANTVLTLLSCPHQISLGLLDRAWKGKELAAVGKGTLKSRVGPGPTEASIYAVF